MTTEVALGHFVRHAGLKPYGEDEQNIPEENSAMKQQLPGTLSPVYESCAQWSCGPVIAMVVPSPHITSLEMIIPWQ